MSSLRLGKAAYLLLWIISAAIYASLLAVFSGQLTLFSGDIGSARFILGTIAGVLAAFLGLLLTVPLIALQMATGRYGYRVYDAFFSWRTLVVLLIFIASILYPVIGLFLLDTGDPSRIVSIGMVLTIGSLSLAVPYIWTIKNILKTDALVDLYADSAIASIGKGESGNAEEKVEILFNIMSIALEARDTSTFQHVLRRLFDIWRSRPKLSVHDTLSIRLSGHFETACSFNETLAKNGLNTLIQIITDARKSGDKEAWGQAIGLIEDLCSTLPPDTCSGLRLYCVEMIGSLGKLTGETEPDIALRIIGALSGSVGIVNTNPYTASRAIRWITWILQDLRTADAFFNIVDIFEKLLNDPSIELEPEVRRIVSQELYHLCEVTAFETFNAEAKADMLNYLIPRLPFSSDETFVSLLALAGARTVSAKGRLKKLEPKIADKLCEIIENSPIEKDVFLREVFRDARSRAEGLNLDIPILKFERRAIRRLNARSQLQPQPQNSQTITAD